MASEIKVDTVSEKTSANGVTIDGVNIKDSKIVTANSVDSDVYVDGSIDTAHIADLNVTTGKIAADAITAAKIADNAVVTAGINADAVTGAKIADDAINSEHYTDGSIDTAHIADGQITTAKLATAVFTGATDIGANIADADLFLMDDGAGGTIRKTAASRIKTYAGFDVSSITGATALTVDPALDDEYIINNGGTLNRVDYKHVSNSGKFLVYDAAVTVANATGTIVTGWSESIDVDGLFASNKYTPTVPGYYYFGATIRADNPGATPRINMGIRKNGSALPSGSFDAETNAVDASYPSVNTSGISYADGDDYFEVHIYHNIGSSHDFFDVGFWGFKLS